MHESENSAEPRRRAWQRRQPSVPPQPRRPPAHPAVRVLAMLGAFVGTVLFSIALARVTLEPSAASAALVHSNVHPGASIEAYLEGTSVKDAAKQLGGNVLLGVPFGVLLPVLLPQARGLLRVALTTAVVMTLVELIQGALVTGRAFDVDDVILNTTGALLGYLFLGRRMGRAVHPRRHHWWQRAPRPVPEQPDPTVDAGAGTAPATDPDTRVDTGKGSGVGPRTGKGTGVRAGGRSLVNRWIKREPRTGTARP
ncbi:VanZ family protein [Streptomyces sp. NPDC057939]|uniref:VanZ family protein n=1 Tax=Streptomyces sp. NPDC057939 TaxID=3346284 RepID=UPI0036E8B634